MATQTYIDWTATIETGGELIMQNDVRVTVSVCEDGEVIIDQIDIIKWGKSVKIGDGHYHRPVDALVPFSESDEPWLIALAGQAAETLYDDERFIEAALDAVETDARDYADGLGDYLYEQSRDRAMEGAE